jgi:hypothetical protein
MRYTISISPEHLGLLYRQGWQTLSILPRQRMSLIVSFGEARPALNRMGEAGRVGFGFAYQSVTHRGGVNPMSKKHFLTCFGI